MIQTGKRARGKESPDFPEHEESEEFVDFRNDSGFVDQGVSDLLEYLEKMTEFLNKPLQDRFTGSIMKLKVESLRLRLKGRKGAY